MDTLKVNAEGRSLCIVTGASRGLGRACALEIAKAFDGNFDFVLTARVSRH
jgi:NAD(P)-dependent dehydrogenase (short-subunit alcohol dehydrogenase family)